MEPTVPIILALALTATSFTFTGRVADAMGAPIEHARVLAACDSALDAAVPETLTDAGGLFPLTLTPGRCTVTVVFEGFREALLVVDGREGGHESRHVTLQIAGLSESV